MASQKQVLHTVQGLLHATALEEQFEVLPILAVNQKRCGTVNAFGHAGFELQQCFLILAVDDTQFGVGLSLQVHIVAWFDGLARRVRFAVDAVLPIAGAGHWRRFLFGQGGERGPFVC